ncbi:MAG: cyclic nucleotide-binding domain-containing protein [Halofilum sp. (in: g-proteobacteria)]
MPQAVTPSDLVRFTPLDSLGRDHLAELSRKGRQVTTPGGRYLFRDGKQPANRLFLLSGTVEIVGTEDGVQVIEAGSPAARSALDSALPQARAARARSEVVALELDRDLLDLMLTWNQSGGYEVEELSGDYQADGDGDVDWMTRLLNTECFRHIPPANIQAIFMRMEAVPFNAGTTVIRQGEAGDYFYMIREGECIVTRTTSAKPEGFALAELGPGDSFGEEALISDRERNATVAMKRDGTLMRLSKEDFTALLTEPLLHWTDYAEAADLAAEGAQWIDVRLPSEFENGHISGAFNIPLFFLRKKAQRLRPETTYILYCDSGRRSSAAAFLLGERGFKVRVLQRGLAKVPAEATSGVKSA